MKSTTERWAIDLGRTEAIAARVSERAGFVFEDEEISRTIEYTKRKCELNGKDEEYFYLLFENELEDLVQRYYINLRGFINQMRKEGENELAQIQVVR